MNPLYNLSHWNSIQSYLDCKMMMMIQSLIFLLFLSSSSQIPIVQSRCNHPTELSALLQFKDTFQINCSGYLYAFLTLGYPKTSSWDNTERLLNGTAEWDGVQCDPISGHVIGLDLSSSCLNGSINSNNNIIFNRLIQLEHLNLAYNYLQGSSIPSELGNLSRLTYLNLSFTGFEGHVPLEMSKLSMLTSHDLSHNENLELNLKSLVPNLTNLEELDLSGMYLINYEIPKFLFTNTSSLRSLKLDNCVLYGEFPQGIFYLPKLQHLSIAGNGELRGHLPTDFNSSTTPLLESLYLFETNFSGTIPDSIGSLVLLRELDLSYCNFSGPIPDSLGKLTNLRLLYLGGANLIGEIPPSLANLTNLSSLHLSGNRLSGQIPSVLANLTQLSDLRLANNQLTGEIPPGFVNLTKLVLLDLHNNTLQGSLPIWNLTSLERLDVGENKLSDTLDLHMFLKFNNLTYLRLSSNNLTLLQKRNVSINSRLLRLYQLELSSCGLFKFPEFLLHQPKLTYLDLSYNTIEGPIPKWMESIESLGYMDLSHNSITGLDDPQLFLRLPNLLNLDISFNMLRGSILFPSQSVMTYRVSNNELTGEIPHSFCNLSSLLVLDLSANHLTGELDPHCFIKSNFMALNLRNNSFHGKIPEFCTSETNSGMRMINLNTNQFKGKIPRSLANCLMLEFFDAGSNFINDTFPYWLGSLPQLKLFILKDNALHGSIGNMSRGHWFPELTIINLSRNRLSGNLTSWHFEKWMAMKNINIRNPSYIGQDEDGFYGYQGALYDYSFTMYNKFIEQEYQKVFYSLVGIDLSSNGFEGEIPTTIGDLRGFRFLNLSNNHLSGVIPSSLGNLTQMESLDLSANSLSGQIPQQLTQLNFLSAFNVSRNNITGRIPQGPQFNTFSNTSYLDNPGLCGEPLSRKCETSRQQDAQTPDEMMKKGDNFWEHFNANILWMVVSIGFGGGLFIGVVVENMVDWRMLILSWRRNRNWRRN